MTLRADITVRLATTRDVAGIVDLESRYYVDNLDASARAKGFISVLHSPQWFAAAINSGGMHVAADNPRSLHTTTTKLGARSLAEFEVDSRRYHLLAFDFADSARS